MLCASFRPCKYTVDLIHFACCKHVFVFYNRGTPACMHATENMFQCQLLFANICTQMQPELQEISHSRGKHAVDFLNAFIKCPYQCYFLYTRLKLLRPFFYIFWSAGISLLFFFAFAQ